MNIIVHYLPEMAGYMEQHHTENRQCPQGIKIKDSVIATHRTTRHPLNHHLKSPLFHQEMRRMISYQEVMTRSEVISPNPIL